MKLQKKSKANTQQMAQTRDEKGRITGGTPPAGFNKNPQNISPGGWKKENTISYQYNRFLNMTPEELLAFANIPDNERTTAMDIAYSRILASRKSLADVKEITDRTEGKPAQFVDMTSNGETLSNLIALPSKRAEDYDADDLET